MLGFLLLVSDSVATLASLCQAMVCEISLPFLCWQCVLWVLGTGLNSNCPLIVIPIFLSCFVSKLLWTRGRLCRYVLFVLILWALGFCQSHNCYFFMSRDYFVLAYQFTWRRWMTTHPGRVVVCCVGCIHPLRSWGPIYRMLRNDCSVITDELV